MSENNVNGITGADVATTTGIVGATIGIGQYIVNDYVITIAATEGDYGYTMTITRGTETQTVTLYGLTSEQYDAMLGYLEAAQTAAQSAQSAQESAQNAQSAAESAATRAETAAGQITGMTAEAETLAPGSPATASFLDGVLSLGIPAGAPGADGNGIVSIVKTSTSGNVDTYTITYTNGTTSTFEVTNGSGGGAVDDVQVNGVSVVSDGVANVPVADVSTLGVVMAANTNNTLTGLFIQQNGLLRVAEASSARVKEGTVENNPIVPYHQHESAFYGLAKAAGDTTQSQSSNAVGNYTESAKSAISEMLGGSVTVTGTTPSITALPGVRYVCGEVSTIDITVPATGIIDVVFTSGSTPAVLTVTPPTGMTMKWTNGFDPTSLDANTVYEINIMDGSLGVAVAWT